MRLGITLLRIAVGGFFIGHGLQKLKGWFGGGGIDGTGQMFESLGLRPGKVHAGAAGVAEAGGGAMLVTGFLTPVAAGMLTGTMTVAVHKVHWRKGPWISNQGYEYNAVLTAAALAIAAEGPGPLSLDHVLGTERSGPAVALAALAAGLLGGAAAVAIGARYPERPPATEPEGVEETATATAPQPAT
jgi:putative oxidoreductase